MKKIFIIFVCFLIIFTLFEVSYASNEINEFKNMQWEYITGDLPSGKDDGYNFKAVKVGSLISQVIKLKNLKATV